MRIFEINKLAILGGDKLLEMPCTRTATDLKYSKSRGRKREERK